MAMVMVLLAACGDGGDGATDTTDETGTTEVQAPEDDEVEEDEEDLPDRCSLVTEEEATALAGYELEIAGDSPLGCAYVPPGEDVADLGVNTVFAEGDAATVTAAGFPNAGQIISVAVGDDTVAVTTPADEVVASIVTAGNGKVVELSLVFLSIEPGDTARIEEAAELAVTALQRWENG
jgi:hypothetical protein